MIAIISGTNREGSNSMVVASHYRELLIELGEETSLIDLKKLPVDFITPAMYDTPHPEVTAILNHTIAKADKYVFIIPEYNGGFPGVLKAFIDVVPPRIMNYKKAGLVGISSGRAGSLRGMDQFTNVLNYLKVSVLFSKPKLSGVESLISNGSISDQRAVKLLQDHAALMTKF